MQISTKGNGNLVRVNGWLELSEDRVNEVILYNFTPFQFYDVIEIQYGGGGGGGDLFQRWS